MLESVPWALDKNVYSAFGWNVPYILSPSGLMFHLRPFFPYKFSVWVIQEEFSLRNMYVRGTLCFMLQAKWTPRCPD